jgi:hypothetical protein
MIVVLIPKGNSGDYRSIGLLEVVWKLIERVLDERMSGIEVHGALHGLRAKRGCNTGIMEAKLVQQLASVEQCPLYGIFIDLRKAYDAMDQERVVSILRDDGVGPKAMRLIIKFWEGADLYCTAGEFYGRLFKAKRGVTQVGPLSPTIFNLMVDAVVRAWLLEVTGSMDILDVRLLLACSYADDGLIVVRDPSLLQRAFDSLYSLFNRVGLKTSTKKTKAMVFLPGRIRTCLSADAHEARMSDLYQDERCGRKVTC